MRKDPTRNSGGATVSGPDSERLAVTAMTAASSTPPRVLVVDDELAIVEAFCETLEAQGYVTGGFTSAPDALAALDGNAFDLC